MMPDDERERTLFKVRTTVVDTGHSKPFPVRRILRRPQLPRPTFAMAERDPPFFFEPLIQLSLAAQCHIRRIPQTQYEVELVVAIGRAQAVSVSRTTWCSACRRPRHDAPRTSTRQPKRACLGASFDFSAPCGPIHQYRASGTSVDRSNYMSAAKFTKVATRKMI